MTVRHIESDEEYKKLLEESKSKLVVIDFFAEWCGPCVRISPEVEKIAAEEKDSVIVAKIDVDKMEELSGSLGVTAMPTFMFFKDGKKVFEFKGADVTTLRKKITELKA